MLANLGMDQLADVFIEDPSTGRYDTIVHSRVPCRLVHMPLRHISTGSDRAELAGMRNLIFDGGVQLPEQCRILVDGVFWAPRPGTFGKYRDWTSSAAYGRCDVTRQQE